MTDPSECAEERCGYQEPHRHGLACDALCPCGKGVQAGMWRFFESQFEPGKEDTQIPKEDQSE